MSHLSFAALRILAVIALPALCAGCSKGDAGPPQGSEEAEREPSHAAAPPAPAASAPAGLVVHEWGTFTSMQGFQGVSLDGLHHEEEELPSFVHSNAGAAFESPFRVYGDHSLDRPARRVNSKMETPVLYFYTQRAQRVTVRVDYENGLLTQWYPAASRALPERTGEGAEGAGSPIDVGAIPRSTLEWEVTLTPDGAGAVPSVPAVGLDNPWQFAREVKSAFVTAEPRGGATDSGESERYIFYRGLGRLLPPLHVTAMPGGTVLVGNRGESPIAVAFVLEMSDAGGRVKRLDSLAPGSTRPVTLAGAPLPKGEVVAGLSREVAEALVGQGLFEDEARAMVRTWAPTWFASLGTRVIYAVPRPLVDAVLPLRITPQPDRVERVLIARHEFLAPEVEVEVDAALRERLSPDADARERATKRLAKLGRFLEPAVRNALLRTSDAGVRASAASVLAAFR